MGKFIGIELNSHSVTFTYLQSKGRRWYLLRCGRNKIEPKEPKESEVGGMASVLKDLFKDVDLLDTKVISTLNNPYLFVREFIFPQMSNKELLEAIRWKAKDYLTFPLEEAIIDAKIIEKISEGQLKRLKVLVVAIPQDAIIQHINILRFAGIAPSQITIAPLAFEHLLNYSIAIKKDESFLTLSIGRELTSVSIYKDCKLQLTRTVTSKLDRLPSEIKLSLDYFLEESHGSKVNKIILFGEPIELREVLDILEQQLPVSIETINPLHDATISYAPANLQTKDGLISGQQIAISLGAALSYGKDINLLPEQVKIQTKDYLLSAGARFLAILGSFVFLFIYLNFRFNIEGYKERLAAAEAELETLKPLVKEIEPLESLNKEVNGQFNLVKSLLKREKIWSKILKEISQLLPESVTLTSLNVSENGVTLRGVVLSAKQSPENILSNFIISLEKGVLKDVSLSNIQKYEERGMLEFSLSSQLDF